MLWFFLAFSTATFESLKDLVGKHTLPRANEYLIAWSWSLFALPILLPVVLLQGPPPIGKPFWVALFFATITVTSSFSLYMKAIKSSDLSLTIPMIASTPVFMLVTSPIIVGEFPPPQGVVGVLLIAVGSYVLNIRERKKGWLAPYKALLNEKGPRIMLLVAFIWSIGGNLDKIGITNSSPFFWIFSLHLCASVATLPLVLWKTRHLPSSLLRNLRYLAPIGLFSAISGITQMTAVAMTLVAYVISVKRFSIIMSVLLGSLLFHEKGLRERLTGVVIMIAGVLFITLLA
jgi:drug/metabolite transporter (DMT)-like permease